MDRVGVFREFRLANPPGRQRFHFSPPELRPCSSIAWYLHRNAGRQVLFEVARGLPSTAQISLAEGALANGQTAFFHRPREEAIERLDFEILSRYRKVIAFARVYGLLAGREKTRELFVDRATEAASGTGGADGSAPTLDIDEMLRQCNAAVDTLLETASPVAACLEPDPTTQGYSISGLGCYVRFDFWVNITSGGSYGHTCYVAKELSEATERFVFVAANKYDLIDDLGLRQIVLDAHPGDGNDENILRANFNYYPQLRAQFERDPPAYIYERISLGNFVSLRLSQEFGIPYIVEYNGSEISMMRSFGGGAYLHEDFYLKVEEAIFRQATIVSVVSAPIKDDLVARGIDAAKIIVNPNGCDPNVYCPIADAEKRSIRRELGYRERDCVIGFTGTFGGWHGMDVLAESLPEICEQAADARFLLIGDGAYREIVENTITRHKLKSRVRLTGRVPQHEGARLLGACDIFISPHSSHMVDSAFFGSPTKIFEYMSMGGAIVASDLEQIGIVLSPALRAADLAAEPVDANTARAVLCTPGSSDSFTEAVVQLARRRELHAPLGQNARMAIIDHYSWKRHVERLLAFLLDGRALESFTREFVADAPAGDGTGVPRPIEDAATVEAAKFVHTQARHTKAWYEEVESHRYEKVAPWLPEILAFEHYSGKQVLEIGAGIGSDLAQFALHGARVTDLDHSAEDLEFARENFRLRGLDGSFVHDTGPDWPFQDASFDLIYCDMPLNSRRNLDSFLSGARRILRPGGVIIATFLADRSLNFWRDTVLNHGIRHNMMREYSLDEIMLRKSNVTRSLLGVQARVFTSAELRRAFREFKGVRIQQRQLRWADLPRRLKWFPLGMAERLVGSRMIVRARGTGIT